MIVSERVRRGIAILAAVSATAGLVLAGPFAAAAHAAPHTFAVNTAGNASDVTIDGKCDTDAATGQQCTLRAALQEANAFLGTDTIAFALAAPYLITLDATGLPPITSPVLIDGTSQTGFNPSGGVIVRVDGTSSTTGVQYGFDVQPGGDGSTIQGLEIVRFAGAGVRLHSDDNVVSGNYLGTRAANVVRCATDGSCGNAIGVLIDGGSNNLIGGTTAPQRNIISNNTRYGVLVDGAEASTMPSGTRISGNYIGTNVAGSAALPNVLYGVYASASNNTVIGGTVSGAGNLISGNTSSGVAIQGGSATVLGNIIGLGADGTTPVPNGYGVSVSRTSSLQLGSAAAGSGNVISANRGGGMSLSTNVGPATVQGNYIGTDVTGSVSRPNGGEYSDALGLASTVSAVVDGNVIDGGYYGLHSYRSTGLTATNNRIGTNAAGTAFLDSQLFAIYLDEDVNSTIGSPGAGNVVNGGYCIWDDMSQGTLIQANLLGTNATGTSVLGCYRGILLYPRSGPSNITVGGTSPGAGNIIGGSSIGLSVGASPVSILGNRIGVGPTGSAVGNAVGIRASAQSTRIGGVGAGEGNMIAYNGTGIDIYGQRVSARGNSVHDNTDLGIDIKGDGLTLNDTDDGDGGPNQRQNYPVLSTSSSTGSGTQLSGSLNSAPDKKYDIDFYSSPSCNASGYGEGATYLGGTTVSTDTSGNVSFDATVSGVAPTGSYLTATATERLTGNTSEFSRCIHPADLPSLSITGASVPEGAGPATFSLTLSSAPSAPVSVEYATSNGTAVSPADYTAKSGTVTFEPGQTIRQVTIKVKNDALDEPDETFIVALSDPTNATIDPAHSSATGTIVDDDAPPTVSVGDVTLAEGDSGTTRFSFPVTLSSRSSNLVTVILSTSDGTATSPADYTARTDRTVVIEPGKTSAKFVVYVNGDTAVESDETFGVDIVALVNATAGDVSATGTILDDD